MKCQIMRWRIDLVWHLYFLCFLVQREEFVYIGL
jgi:hypothetical protein